MSMAEYISVVAAGVILFWLGWFIADLQLRVRDLERRLNDHRGAAQ